MRRLATLCFLGLFLTAVSVAAASSPIAGIYVTTISGKPAQLDGKWILSFAGNGGYAVAKAPKTSAILIGGRSTTAGHTLTMVDGFGPLACTGASAKGTYSWRFSGTTLKLAKKHDTCAGRPLVLAGSWTKVG
jgi:hypothetical protein